MLRFRKTRSPNQSGSFRKTSRKSPRTDAEDNMESCSCCFFSTGVVLLQLLPPLLLLSLLLLSLVRLLLLLHSPGRTLQSRMDLRVCLNFIQQYFFCSLIHPRFLFRLWASPTVLSLCGFGIGNQRLVPTKISVEHHPGFGTPAVLVRY